MQSNDTQSKPEVIEVRRGGVIVGGFTRPSNAHSVVRFGKVWKLMAQARNGYPDAVVSEHATWEDARAALVSAGW